MTNPGETFLSTCIRRFRVYKELGDKSFDQLTDPDFHYQPDPGSNSIAIIIQHLSGNMLSRWTNFLTEDGEKSWREREAEFAIHAFSREELIRLWEDGWSCLLNALNSLTGDDLLKTVTIRQEPLQVIDAVTRQLAHYPYHVGQIVYLARSIRKEEWKSLSIPKGESEKYNQQDGIKDPAKKFT